MKMGQQLSPLEDGILFSILTLPMSYVHVFRGLSKRWKSLIDGEHFASRFKELLLQPAPASAFLLPLDFGDSYHLALLDVTGQTYWVREFDRLLPNECTQSVEGIIFYYPNHDDDFDHHHRKTALFNPTIPALKILPITDSRELPTFVRRDGEYAEDWFKRFAATGLDPANQDIIILVTWLFCGSEQMGEHEGQVAGHELFRSQSGEWKTLQGRGPIQASRGSICVDGIIYFLTREDVLEHQEIKIVPFLIGSEHFANLSLPDRMENWDEERDEKRELELKLVELRGRVTLLDAKITENGEGISIFLSSLEDHAGPKWTDRHIQLILNVPWVFIGSGTAGELIIVPEQQGRGLHVWLCDVERGTVEQVDFEDLSDFVRENSKAISHAPIGYEFSTRFV